MIGDYPLTPLEQLPRNDVAACEAYYLEHGVTDDEMHVMWKLQDDPAAFVEASANWKIRKSR